MTELRVRPEAEVDTFEAALWYEGERNGLGAVFLQALRGVLARIEIGPLQFPLVTADIRRALLGRFPFGVFFFVEGQGATVIAVMHLHRNPSSWQERR
jgi:hypothetical protein